MLQEQAPLEVILGPFVHCSHPLESASAHTPLLLTTQPSSELWIWNPLAPRRAGVPRRRSPMTGRCFRAQVQLPHLQGTAAGCGWRSELPWDGMKARPPPPWCPCVASPAHSGSQTRFQVSPKSPSFMTILHTNPSLGAASAEPNLRQGPPASPLSFRRMVRPAEGKRGREPYSDN